MSQAIIAAQSIVLRASLPNWVNGVKYVRNHHYIELEDKKGNIHRLAALSLIKGVCTACAGVVFVSSRLGAMICPHCVAGEVNWVWGEAQLSFVPEMESGFRTGDLDPLGEEGSPTDS